MRDIYSTDIERSRFHNGLRGERLDPEEETAWWQPWFDLMAANVAAGKTLRRLRIVSEPVTDYIRFEWLDAFNLVKAGEDVRWLRAAGRQRCCCRAMTVPMSCSVS